MPTMRILSEQQVRDVTDRAMAWSAVEAAYRQFGENSDIQSRPSIMRIPGPRPHLGRPELGQYRVKGASVPNCGVAGAFLSAREYGYMFLWDVETDEPIGLVACDWLSQFRVALTAAITIKALVTTAPQSIAFFGAGRYATEACRLIAQQWPHADLVVLASKLESAQRFAASMPRPVRASDNPRSAVANADVVLTITNAPAPIVQGGWLKPGALALSMGSAHELDIAVLRDCAGIVVDDLSYACTQGDIAAWIRRGELAEAELPALIRGNIGEVINGTKAGRRSAEERILAVIQGLTACDVALAKAVLDHASERNVGEIAKT